MVFVLGARGALEVLPDLADALGEFGSLEACGRATPPITTALASSAS
jgi:hypothetical protein